MAITLRIENFEQLADGGPLEFTAGERGFDIGREHHLDWCLPDPSRIVSGLHCQVRYESGAYWLHDHSRNGTFVNDAPGRVKSPYRLAHGDRLQIGDYYVRVTLSGGAEAADAPRRGGYRPPADSEDMWSLGNAAPSPIDRRAFAHEQRRGGHRAPDVLDHFIDLPKSGRSGGAPFVDPLRDQPGPDFRGVAASHIPERPPAPGRANAALATGLPDSGPHYGGADQRGAVGPFLAAVANAAGMSSQALSGRPPEAIAEEIGFVLRIATEQLAVLLKGRAAAKLMTKSGDRTMVGADRNNPLKFVPTPSEALEIMFQKNRPGYLGAPESFREGFENIRSHELATYAAMQKALAKLMEDFAPDSIEEKAGSAAFGSRKARAWDVYVERWKAIEKNENGALDVFLAYFREAYDNAVKKG